jgi:hypothetical protein
MAVITQAGASGMTVDPVTSLGLAELTFRADFEGLSRRFAVLMLRFNGVDFEGVFCRPRGVGAAVLEGVFLGLVGVVFADLT